MGNRVLEWASKHYPVGRRKETYKKIGGRIFSGVSVIRQWAFGPNLSTLFPWATRKVCLYSRRFSVPRIDV